MTDMLSRTIDRYQIEELIGEGAMARVYRAFDPKIHRSVALKVLKENFCVDEEYLSRFLREAKAAGALQHPNIVTVFDVGTIDNAPYTMMELLEGRDLGEVLADSGKLPLERTIIIIMQLCKALDYAHSSGVVHRDIKPDNIIVGPDGVSIKVADFGVARMDDTDEAQKTQIGSVLGTPRYMSPEQALGEAVDGRSDLFAVGVILYEMLTGVKAFDGNRLSTLMTQITQKEPAPIKDLCPSLPAGLRQIVQKLLQKKPEKRYQTGDEVVAALAKELQALRDQQEEQGKHKYIPLKVRWSLSMGAIVALVMLISMSVVFNIQSRTMTDQAVDSGASFAKFIATQIAIPLLSEDWIFLETFITEAASRDTFSYLYVIDQTGIVRGASDLKRVGLTWIPDSTQTFIVEKDEVMTTSLELGDGSIVFNVVTPVLFQETEIGSIVLGLSQDSLIEVKRVTGWLMLSLAAVTITSLVAVLFVFGGLIVKPLKLVSKTMRSFGAGDLDVRISQTRNDEIGELFASFNHMAAEAQKVISPESEEQRVATETAAKILIPEQGAAASEPAYGATKPEALRPGQKLSVPEQVLATLKQTVSALKQKVLALKPGILALKRKVLPVKTDDKVPGGLTPVHERDMTHQEQQPAPTSEHKEAIEDQETPIPEHKEAIIEQKAPITGQEKSSPEQEAPPEPQVAAHEQAEDQPEQQAPAMAQAEVAVEEKESTAEQEETPNKKPARKAPTRKPAQKKTTKKSAQLSAAAEAPQGDKSTVETAKKPEDKPENQPAIEPDDIDLDDKTVIAPGPFARKKPEE